jgi:endoglucanase
MVFGDQTIALKPAANTATTYSPVDVSSAPQAAPARNDAGDMATILKGVVARGPISKRRLSIMFSCRRSDEGTPVILEALKSHRAKASFFASGEFLSQPANAAFAQSVSAQGHYVGPQSDKWTRFLESVPSAAAASSLDMEAHMKQLASLGIQRKDSRFFLPTSDQVDNTAAQRGRDSGLVMVGGTIGTLSFATATVEGTKEFASSQQILESILKLDRASAAGLNGFLLLFPLDSGARRTDLFYTRFGQLLDELQNRGYELVRVDELVNL